MLTPHTCIFASQRQILLAENVVDDVMRRWSHRDRFRASSSSHQASIKAVKTIHDFFHVCKSLWRCGWRREEITRILLPRVKGSFDQCRLKMDSFINNPTNLCHEEFIHLETRPWCGFIDGQQSNNPHTEAFSLCKHVDCGFYSCDKDTCGLLSVWIPAVDVAVSLISHLFRSWWSPKSVRFKWWMACDLSRTNSNSLKT